MREADFQAKVIKWLKSKGCIVIKMQQNATTHSGIADLAWFYKTKYGFLEVKKDEKSRFRPLQKRFLDRVSKWSCSAVVYPENFDMIKEKIIEVIHDEDLQS